MPEPSADDKDDDAKVMAMAEAQAIVINDEEEKRKWLQILNKITVDQAYDEPCYAAEVESARRGFRRAAYQRMTRIIESDLPPFEAITSEDRRSDRGGDCGGSGGRDVAPSGGQETRRQRLDGGADQQGHYLEE